MGPADSRAGHWVRGAGKDGTTELLRGGGTSLFFFVLILVILGNSWDSQSRGHNVMLLCARTCLMLEEAVGKIERLGVKGALSLKTFQTI